MKNYIKRTTWIAFCVLTASSLFFASAPMDGQAEKSVPVHKLEHYEDNAIGFSIDYDPEKLNKEMGPIGSFVFRRESAESRFAMPVDRFIAWPITMNTGALSRTTLPEWGTRRI